MTRIVSLNNTLHRELRILPDRLEALGSAERMVPVVLSEFQKLIAQYPIVLTKNEDTGRFTCVALLGFDAGENLFWNEHGWDGIYTPLNITRQPFFLGHDEQSGDDHLVCVDAESPCLSTDEGERLFDDDGSAAPFLSEMQNTLAGLLEGERETARFIAALSERELLVSLKLEITFADSQTRQITGLYSIDENRLDQLDADELHSLNQRGYLKAIHLMIGSLAHLYGLIERKNTRLERSCPSH